MLHDKRHDEIFQCIVESYIDTAAPVGSTTVSKRYAGNLSPATIRNVMADLEEAGLIEQPHTSAGRVPTDRGYRYYVDSLMHPDADPAKDLSELAEEALREIKTIEEAAERMSRLIADITHNAGLLYLRGAKSRLYLDGARNIFDQPEFQDAGRIRSLFRTLELKDSLVDFLQNLEVQKLRIYIGREVPCAELEGVSVIVKEYSVDGVPVGSLGVIGPTRMRYDRVSGVVDQMADAMTEFLTDEL